jgi:hypothetical protein
MNGIKFCERGDEFGEVARGDAVGCFKSFFRGDLNNY